MSKVIEIVTEKILSYLEKGVKPWRKEWKDQPFNPFHKNHTTNNLYSGINQLNLALTAMEANYQSTHWVTAKQAKSIGGTIKKGEKGTPILYACQGAKCPNCEKKFWDESTCACGQDLSTIRAWRFYKVFNLEQTEGIKIPANETRKPASVKVRNTIARQFVKNINPDLRHGGNRAYYSPTNDHIQMPKFEQFKTEEAYWSTLLHEVTHWTGHKSRLARDFSGRFGDSAYAFEELIAELGSAYVNAHLDIQTDVQNHANYIGHWHQALKKEPKHLVEACSKATKAYQFLIEQAGDYTQNQPMTRPETEPAQPVATVVSTPKTGHKKHGVAKDERQRLADELVLHLLDAEANPDNNQTIIVTYGSTEYRIIKTPDNIKRIMKALGFKHELKGVAA